MNCTRYYRVARALAVIPLAAATGHTLTKLPHSMQGVEHGRDVNAFGQQVGFYLSIAHLFCASSDDHIVSNGVSCVSRKTRCEPRAKYFTPSSYFNLRFLVLSVQMSCRKKSQPSGQSGPIIQRGAKNNKAMRVITVYGRVGTPLPLPSHPLCAMQCSFKQCLYSFGTIFCVRGERNSICVQQLGAG